MKWKKRVVRVAGGQAFFFFTMRPCSHRDKFSKYLPFFFSLLYKCCFIQDWCFGLILSHSEHISKQHPCISSFSTYTPLLRWRHSPAHPLCPPMSRQQQWRWLHRCVYLFLPAPSTACTSSTCPLCVFFSAFLARPGSAPHRPGMRRCTVSGFGRKKNNIAFAFPSLSLTRPEMICIVSLRQSDGGKTSVIKEGARYYLQWEY